MHNHPSSRPTPFDHHTTFNHLLPCPAGDHNPSLFLSSQSSDRGLFKQVVDGFQFAYEGSTTTTSQAADHHLRFQGTDHETDLFGIRAETAQMTAQEIVDAKAAAASKSHSEAERRRRERINNHLTKLRSLLPNTTKTDKASLLAEVIQHLKELKHQTSVIGEQRLVPTEINELTIDNTSDEEGRMVIRASLCCEDRSDLLPDLIKTLKMLRLRTLKAEITTLGRRVKNVLFVTREEEDWYDHSSSRDGHERMVDDWVSLIEEALKEVVEKTDEKDDSSIGTSNVVKRQRTNSFERPHRRSLRSYAMNN